MVIFFEAIVCTRNTGHQVHLAEYFQIFFWNYILSGLNRGEKVFFFSVEKM